MIWGLCFLLNKSMQEFVNSRTGATSERCLLVRAKIHLLLMTMQLLLSASLGAPVVGCSLHNVLSVLSV